MRALATQHNTHSAFREIRAANKNNIASIMVGAVAVAIHFFCFFLFVYSFHDHETALSAACHADMISFTSNIKIMLFMHFECTCIFLRGALFFSQNMNYMFPVFFLVIFHAILKNSSIIMKFTCSRSARVLQIAGKFLLGSLLHKINYLSGKGLLLLKFQ